NIPRPPPSTTRPHAALVGCAGVLFVGDVVTLNPAGIGVAQHHVGLAEAAEVAEACDLPIQTDRAQRGGARDVVVADVVDLERAASWCRTTARECSAAGPSYPPSRPPARPWTLPDRSGPGACR